MNRTAAVAFRWLGGLLLLMVPFALVAGFWAPRAVQFLNPVVCEKAEHIDNHGYRTGPGDADPIELVCRGPEGLRNSLGRMLGVCGVFVIAGLGCFWASNRMTPTRTRVPGHIPHA